jgi:phosphate starvation-inducible protein PhoH
MASKKRSADGSHSGEKRDNSPYVFKDQQKLDFTLTIRENIPFTDKQKELFEIIQDKNTKMLFISGPAGCSKTMSAVYCGLHELNNKKANQLVYLRAALECSDSKLGMLPGEIKEKLEEFLPGSQISQLIAKKHVEGAPISFLRGRHMTNRFIIVDEAQSLTKKELITIITRLGEHSKIILCADPYQSDLPNGKIGGFEELKKIFSDEESKQNGIFTFDFLPEDIVRSKLVKFIVQKLDIYSKPPDKEGEWKPNSK